MGKHGPCYHCGVTSTPLWRNGPPDKPILCNACGSRWRTKGSLINYTPLHARGPLDNLEEFKSLKEKLPVAPSLKTRDQKLYKIKETNVDVDNECDQDFHNVFDKDISNRSSSGSAVSYSESCAHFCTNDSSDVTGSFVPSKKRTGATRTKTSSVEKLTKDLHFILHQKLSYVSGLLEEELLYENVAPKGSVEIGNGSVLIRNPNLGTPEEESEASSLLIENKSVYSELPFPVHHRQNEEIISSNYGTGKFKRTTHPAGQEHMNRDELGQENLRILKDRCSQLGFMDLNDVVCFEGFMKHLTHKEQHHLLKYLPSSDTAQTPESLLSMFSSPQFQEMMSCFQMLLWEGLFDLSFSGASDDECRSLNRLVLLNLKKSTWVVEHKILKDSIHKRSFEEIGVSGGTTNFDASSGSASSLKRLLPQDEQNQNFQEMNNVLLKKPRRPCKAASEALKNPDNAETEPTHHLNSEYEYDDYMDNAIGSQFFQRSLLCFPSETNFTDDDKPDQDLLLDVHSNSSFPEAQLLSNAWKSKAVVPNSISTESGVSCPSSSSTSKQPFFFTNHI